MLGLVKSRMIFPSDIQIDGSQQRLDFAGFLIADLLLKVNALSFNSVPGY